MVEGSRKDRKSKKKLNFYKLKTLTSLIITLGLILGIGFTGYLLYLAYSIDDVVLQGEVYPSSVFARDQSPLAVVEASKADYVPLREMSPYFVNAVIAVEDNVFYSHPGVNPIGIARALVTNIRNRRVTQGGSTITQQLAKNIFLTHERTLDRKLKELVYTFKLEYNYSKDEILEAYLNNIYYGHGNYGVGAASEYYFGKRPAELTLDEAALLAGIIQGPYLYTPRNPNNITPRNQSDEDIQQAYKENNSETVAGEVTPGLLTSRTYTRRSFVLSRMVQLEYITQEQAQEANQVFINPPAGAEEQREQTQLPLYVLSELDRIEVLLGLETGTLRNGYNIFTTVDPGAQIEAQNNVASFRQYIPEDKRGDNNIQSAIVAMDPQTGGILAMAGGRNAFEGIPKPGSAFKPIAYALALESQKYTLINQYFCTDITGVDPNDSGWSPSDFGGTFHETNLTMRQAIIESCNIYAALTNTHLGPANVREFAFRLGYDGFLQPGSAMVLGTTGVEMPNMASVYAVFANGGFRVHPYIIEEIQDSFGNTIYRHNTRIPQRVISEEAAFLLTDSLRGVLRAPLGTGRGAASLIPNRDAAAKTGTTDDYVYTAGYTPEMVTVTYIGFNTPAGKLGFTSGPAARLWATFTNNALNRMLGQNVGSTFQVPDRVVQKTLCSDTLLLATPNCPNTFNEYFIEGTGPEEYCNIHQPQTQDVDICIQSWKRATEYCPSNTVIRYRFGPHNQIPPDDCDIHPSVRWPRR